MATNVYNLFKQGVQTAQKGIAVLSKPEVIEPLKKKNVKRVEDANLMGGNKTTQSRPEFGTNIAPIVNNRFEVNLGAKKAINDVGNRVIEGVESGIKSFTGIGNAVGNTVSSPFKTAIKSTSEFLKPYTDGVLKSIAPVAKVVNDLGASTIPLGKPIVEGLDQGTQPIREALGAFMGMVNNDKGKFDDIKKGTADIGSPEFKVYSIVKEKAGERGVETYEAFKKNAEKLNEENPDLFREGLKTYIKGAGTFVDLLERPIRKTVLPWFYYGMATLGDTVGGEELTPERLKRNQLMAEYVSGGRLDGVARLFGAGLGLQSGQLPDPSLMGDMIQTETGTRAEVAKELGQLYGVSKDEIHQAWNDSTLFGMPVLSVLDTITSYASSIGEAMLAPSMIRLGAQLNSSALTGIGKGLAFGSKLTYPTAIGTTALDMGMRFLSPDKAQGLYAYLTDGEEDVDLQQDIQVMGGIATLGTLFKVVGKVMPSSKPLSLLDQVKVMQDAINKVNTDPGTIKAMLGQFKKDYEVQVDYLMRPEAGKQGVLTVNDLHKLDDVIKQLPPDIQKGLQDVQMKLFYSSFEEDWVGGYALSQAKKLGLNIDTLRRTLDDFKSGKKGEVEANETLIHEIGHLAQNHYKADPEWEGIVKQTTFGDKGKYMFTNEGELFAEGLRKFYRSPEMLKAEAPKLYDFMDKVSKEITNAFQSPIMKLEGQPVEAMGRQKEIEEGRARLKQAEEIKKAFPKEFDKAYKAMRKAQAEYNSQVYMHGPEKSKKEAKALDIAIKGMQDFYTKGREKLGIENMPRMKPIPPELEPINTVKGAEEELFNSRGLSTKRLREVDGIFKVVNPPSGKIIKVDGKLTDLPNGEKGVVFRFRTGRLSNDGIALADIKTGKTLIAVGERFGDSSGTLNKGEITSSQLRKYKENPNLFISDAIKELQTNQATGKEFMPRMKNVPVYHGGDSKVEVFKSEMGGGVTGAQSAKEAIWFTDDIEVAKGYALYAAESGPINKLYREAQELEKIAQRSGKQEDWAKYDKKIVEAEEVGSYENTFNRREKATTTKAFVSGDFYEVDAKGKTPQELSKEGDIDSWLTQQIQIAKKMGKDGVIFKNLDDAAGFYDKPATHYAVFKPENIKTESPEFMPRMGVEKGEMETYEPLTPKNEPGKRQMATKYYDLTPEGVETLKNLRKLMGIQDYKKRTFAEIEDVAKMLSSDPNKLIAEINTKRITADQVEGLKKTIKTSIEFISEAQKELKSGVALDPKALEMKIAQVDGTLQAAVKKLAIGNTEAARALVANRILSTDATDPAFWIYRAEKVTNGAMTPMQRAVIIELAGKKDQLGLASFVTALEKTDWADKAIGFWKAGLLTQPMTHIKNMGSNVVSNILNLVKDVPAVAADKLMAMATGKRTVAFAEFQDVWRGVNRGFIDAQDVLKYGITEGDTLKGEFHKRITYNNKWVDAYVNGVFKALSAEDKVAKGLAYEVTIGGQAKVQGLNEGLKGEALQLRADELRANPTKEMVDMAEKTSKEVTYNNDNRIANGISGLKRGIRYAADVTSEAVAGKATGADAAARMITESAMPFVRTPTNVALAMVDYSPAGLIKTIYNLAKGNQKVFVENLGRNITGTGFIVLGHYLASQGMFKGVYPEGGDTKKEWQARGYRAGDLVIDGKQINLMGFSPVGNLLQLGAAYYEIQQTEPSLYKQIENTALNGLKGLTEQTFLLGVSRILSAVTQPKQYAGSWAEGTISGMVPSIIRALAEASDKYQRETDGILDSIKYSLPGLRQTLPPRRDVLGEPIKTTGAAVLGDTSGFFERALVKMFDPARSTIVNTSPLFDEYERLQGEGIEKAFPSVPPDYGTYSKSVYVGEEKYPLKVKYKMDNETYNLFRKVQGKMMAIASLEAVKTTEYQLLNDEDKAATLDDFYRQSVIIAKDFVLPVMMEKDPQFSADVKNQMNSFGATEIPKVTSIDVQKALAKHKSEGPPTPKIKVEAKPFDTNEEDNPKTPEVEGRDDFELAGDYARAFVIDPENALKAFITKEKLGVVRGNLVEMQRFYGLKYTDKGGSEEYKQKRMEEMGIPWSEAENYKLEHILPVKAGGDTSDANLVPVTNAEHDFYTPVEGELIDYVQSGKITRQQAQILAIAFKVDKTLTAEELIAKLHSL